MWRRVRDVVVDQRPDADAAAAAAVAAAVALLAALLQQPIRAHHRTHTSQSQVTWRRLLRLVSPRLAHTELEVTEAGRWNTGSGAITTSGSCRQ